MKTISGKTISSKTLSLSQAAKILSRFVTIDNGASTAVGVYLHRASEAFDDLNQFHKEVKARQSGRKSKKSLPDSVEPSTRESELHSSNHEGVERETKKNKKGKKVAEGLTSQTGQSDGDVVSENRSGLELANGDQKFSEMDNEKKKNKSKKYAREIEDADGEQEEVGRRKKRKSAEIAENGVEGSSVENHGKKSKRRKSEA